MMSRARRNKYNAIALACKRLGFQAHPLCRNFAVIKWMRMLMEEGLGWKHGVQFVCLAFQNAMAAAINGYTLHHWSGIPVKAKDGATGDKHKQSIKCQALQVIIIDEVSMISAELLGALEYIVSASIRTDGTYKKRHNGHKRVFGGVNVVMCADFWQLHPVRGTFIADNPLYVDPGRAQQGLNLLWGFDDEAKAEQRVDSAVTKVEKDSIRSYWPLTQVMRCKDVWYNSFLQECRNGSLSMDSFSFFHGLPTFTSPCTTCVCNAKKTKDPVLGVYRQSWKEAFMNGCPDMKAFIERSEEQCTSCTAERKRRHRVLSDLNHIPPELHGSLYSSAPALYSFNVPRYFSIQLRAREFAKQQNVQLSWCYARDVPLHPGDRELKYEALQAKLAAWLRRHDQETSHLASLIPLARSMPIRLTDNVDRELQLYRGRRGRIYGWTLSPQCIPEEVDGEFLLSHLPLVIYLEFPEATWRIGKLPPGVYPLKPRSKTWKVNKYTGIEARRTGFWIVPDFGSTAHMIQGASLDATFVDAQEASSNVSTTLQIAAYVCLSRVKELRGISVLQPFSPSHAVPLKAQTD